MNRSSWMLIALPLCGFLGCEFHDRHDDDWDGYGQPACGSTLQGSTIDIDAPLETDLGEGVGLFVEYQAGGRWRFFTTCDTALSDFECYFDVVISSVEPGSFLGLIPEEIESDDTLELIGQDTLRFRGWTSTDTDGFSVDTEPGGTLQIDLLLDGECGNRYLYWMGDGAIHAGAPSNPFELKPVEF